MVLPSSAGGIVIVFVLLIEVVVLYMWVSIVKI